MITRARILVGGSVQGVGYRYAVAKTAQDMDVRGVVRNLADGMVEIFCSTDSMELMKEFVSRISTPKFMITVDQLNVFYEGEEGYETHPHHEKEFGIEY